MRYNEKRNRAFESVVAPGSLHCRPGVGSAGAAFFYLRILFGLFARLAKFPPKSISTALRRMGHIIVTRCGQPTAMFWREVPMVENCVRKYRKAAKLTLHQLADRSGVPVSTINDIERGAEPRVITAIRIAQALGVRVEKLWPV